MKPCSVATARAILVLTYMNALTADDTETLVTA